MMGSDWLRLNAITLVVAWKSMAAIMVGGDWGRIHGGSANIVCCLLRAAVEPSDGKV